MYLILNLLGYKTKVCYFVSYDIESIIVPSPSKDDF